MIYVTGQLLLQKRHQRICIVSRCMKSKIASSSLCPKHKRARQKMQNPYRYWYDVLRQNARARKIFFDLDFEYWKDWCDETGYLIIKGKGAEYGTVDRIRPELGYVKGNLQILTCRANSKKVWVDKMLREKYGVGLTFTALEKAELKELLEKVNGGLPIKLYDPGEEDYF